MTRDDILYFKKWQDLTGVNSGEQGCRMAREREVDNNVSVRPRKCAAAAAAGQRILRKKKSTASGRVGVNT